MTHPHTHHGRLKFVGPEVMQAFVEYNAKRGKLAMVERCILHLDIASMDFHQVVTVCREHELWEGLIYVYNKGLGDYLTPLDFMMQSLQALIATPPVADEASTREWSTRRCGLADKTLAYIFFCLSGTSIPTLHVITTHARTRTRTTRLSCFRSRV